MHSGSGTLSTWFDVNGGVSSSHLFLNEPQGDLSKIGNQSHIDAMTIVKWTSGQFG